MMMVMMMMMVVVVVVVTHTNFSRYSSFFDYGGIIGGVGAGFLADRIKSQAWVAFGCLVCGIAALFVFQKYTANIADDQLLEYKLLMMMVGMFINAPYALITTAVSADLGTTTKGDNNLLATVTGIIDGTGSIGAAIQVCGRACVRAYVRACVRAYVRARVVRGACVLFLRAVLFAFQPTNHAIYRHHLLHHGRRRSDWRRPPLTGAVAWLPAGHYSGGAES